MGELIKRTTKHFISNNNCSSNGHNNPSSNRNNGNIYRRQKHNPGSGFEPAVFLMLSQALSVCVSCGHLFFSVCWYRNTSSLSLSFIILCVCWYWNTSSLPLSLIVSCAFWQYWDIHSLSLSLMILCTCWPYWVSKLYVTVHHTEIPTVYSSVSLWLFTILRYPQFIPRFHNMAYIVYPILEKAFWCTQTLDFFMIFFLGGGGGEGEYLIIPCGKSGSPYPGKSQQPQEHRYPFLSVCGVFSCIQTMIWLPMFGIFNVRSDADACDCTRGLCGHRKRVRTESWPREKNPLPHPGLEPASVLRLALSSVPVTMWGTVKHVRSVWSTRRVPRRHTRTRP